MFDVTNPANPVTDIVGYGDDGADFSNGLLYAIQRNELSTFISTPPRRHTSPLSRSHNAPDLCMLWKTKTAYITSPNADTLTIISIEDCACNADFNADVAGQLNDITISSRGLYVPIPRDRPKRRLTTQLLRHQCSWSPTYQDAHELIPTIFIYRKQVSISCIH
ncbi:MAG: hypothetical protein R3B67_02355 [Phycisphaerales bacterium]